MGRRFPGEIIGCEFCRFFHLKDAGREVRIEEGMFDAQSKSSLLRVLFQDYHLGEFDRVMFFKPLIMLRYPDCRKIACLRFQGE